MKKVVIFSIAKVISVAVGVLSADIAINNGTDAIQSFFIGVLAGAIGGVIARVICEVKSQ
jgi:uncharacterized membrane protein YeiH